MSFTAGQKLRASQMTGVVARGSRTTDSTTFTTTEQGVLRLDSVPIVSGRLYRIWTSPLIFGSTVANDLIQVSIRASTSGNATTSSTLLTVLAENSYSASGQQKAEPLSIEYPSSTTGSLSVLLSAARVSGTGTCKISAFSTIPCSLIIEDIGVDPGNTGVAI